MESVRDSSYQYEKVQGLLSGPERQLGGVALDFAGMELAVMRSLESEDPIESGLKRKIVGQPEAVESIMAALNRGEFRNPKRPIASLLFMGPTGVGKSEMAKELAILLNGDDHAFLKIDCSQYSNGHEVSALVGAPPSYVGREQKPRFDPYLIEQHRSVILFDEIEKGHQKLHDLMLQILDDGQIDLLNSDAKVSFRNSIIIATSNVGSQEISDLIGGKKIGFHDQEVKEGASKNQINKASFEALKRRFRPELIGRFDDRIVFSALDDTQLGVVLDRYVTEMNGAPESMAKGVNLTLVPELRDKIVAESEGRDQLGARPVLRQFEKTIWREYAQHLSHGSIPRNCRVVAAPTTPDEW